MQVQVSTELAEVEDPKEFQRFCSAAISNIVSTVNGKLEFDKNMLTKIVYVPFSTANTDVAIQHTFNRTDVNYIVIRKNGTCDIFQGATPNTTTTLYLRSSQAANVYLILF